MTLNIDLKSNYKWPIKQSNQIARAFESATDKRIIIRVYIRIFIAFTMSVQHLVKFLGIIWGKLRKNKRKYLFYFKTLLFFLHHREKVGWLKAIDTANFKITYDSNQISKKWRLWYIPKKIIIFAYFCLNLIVSFLFFLVFLIVFLWEHFWLIIALGYLHYFK